MDGQFVPNITFGPHLTADINKITTFPLDVHLMIINPGNFIENFIDSGADNITLHIESTAHVHRHLEKIKNLGATAGISLNPGTPISSIIEILDIVDLVLVMSVNPGFGGQKFIKSSLEKIRKLNNIRIENNYSFQLEVDGGVSKNNAESLVSSGVDILVAGNSIFKSPDIKSAIKDIRDQAEKAC
jgi:ribulose-phosphate 3-epimerase